MRICRGTLRHQGSTYVERIRVTGMKGKLQPIGTILQGTIRGTCEYMLVLLTILECNSVYRCIWGRPDSVYYLETAALLCGAVLLASLLWGDRHGLACLFDSCPLLCAVMLFLVLFLFLNAIRTGAAWAVSNYMLVFLMFLPLMLAIFKAYHGMSEPYRLFHVLSDIMFVLASLSLVIWILAVVARKLQPTGEAPVEWAWTRQAQNYFNLCFYWQMEPLPFSGGWIMRNTGIFPESPMYNIFLNTALYTELFLRDKANWLKCALFSITIGTTIGTLGVLLCIGGWVMKLFPALKSKKARSIGYAALALSAMLGVILVRQKWQMGQGSFATHIDDYLASLKAWAAHPVIGCGYENEPFIQGYMSTFRWDNLGLSNSITVVLAEGGLFLFTFYLLPFLFLVINGIKTAGKGIAWWTLGVFGIYATTIFHYRFFMAMLLAFGYSYARISYSETKGPCFRCTGTESSPQASRNGGSGPQPDKGDNLPLYLLTAAGGICILAAAFSETVMTFITGLFAKYRLGLGDSQWRAISLAMLFALCINAAKSTIGTVRGIKEDLTYTQSPDNQQQHWGRLR